MLCSRVFCTITPKEKNLQTPYKKPLHLPRTKSATMVPLMVFYPKKAWKNLFCINKREGFIVLKKNCSSSFGEASRYAEHPDCQNSHYGEQGVRPFIV